jgi:hypothetical protein
MDLMFCKIQYLRCSLIFRYYHISPVCEDPRHMWLSVDPGLCCKPTLGLWWLVQASIGQLRAWWYENHPTACRLELHEPWCRPRNTCTNSAPHWSAPSHGDQSRRIIAFSASAWTLIVLSFSFVIYAWSVHAISHSDTVPRLRGCWIWTQQHVVTISTFAIVTSKRLSHYSINVESCNKVEINNRPMLRSWNCDENLKKKSKLGR